MGIYSSVDCQEIYNTDTEQRDAAGWTRTVQLQCAWSDRKALVVDLLGTPRSHPDEASLIASRCGTAPFATEYTADGQEIVYQNARVTVQYSVPGGEGGEQTPQDPVNLISEEVEPYTRVITQNYKDFIWASDDAKLKEGEGPGKVIHGVKLVKTFFYIASVGSGILTLPGTVHNRSYISSLLGLTFASGTLLFVPPVLSRTISTAGASAWNMKLSWDYNENEWNKVWRGEQQIWDSLKRADNGAPVETFPLTDHTPYLP